MAGVTAALAEFLGLVAALIRRVLRERETRKREAARKEIARDPAGEFRRRYGPGGGGLRDPED